MSICECLYLLCHNIYFVSVVVEDLFKSREPVPEMKAIYFMSPTAKVCNYNPLVIILHLDLSLNF